jgi:hypothetical protein
MGLHIGVLVLFVFPLAHVVGEFCCYSLSIPTDILAHTIHEMAAPVTSYLFFVHQGECLKNESNNDQIPSVRPYPDEEKRASVIIFSTEK